MPPADPDVEEPPVETPPDEEGASRDEAPPAAATPETAAAPGATQPRDLVAERNARHIDAYQQADTALQQAFDKAQPFAPINTPATDDYTRAKTRTAFARQADQNAGLQEQSDRENATAQRAQRTARNKAYNSSVLGDMLSSGQRHYTDPETGRLTPILDQSGKPLYTKTAFEETVNPDTGEPAFARRTTSGKIEYQRPTITKSPDPTDEQVYYNMRNGDFRPAGHYSQFLSDPDLNVQRTALAVRKSVHAAQWNDRINKFKTERVDDINSKLADNAAQLAPGVKVADPKDQLPPTLRDQSDELSAKIGALETDNQLKETTGGFLGSKIGAHPSDAAMAKTSQRDSLQTQLDQVNAQIDERKAQTKTLKLQKTAADLHMGVMKAQAAQDSYRNQLDEAKVSGKQRGIADDDNQTIQEIINGHESVGDGLDRYTPMRDRAITGLQQHLDSQPQPGEQPTPAPAATPDQQGEPFALAARGVKSVGGVSIQDIARRYGSGQGPVQPVQLLAMKQQSDGIAQTLADKNTQLDPKVQKSLADQKTYLDQLYTQRFAKLAPDQQKRVIAMTRDPTTGEKLLAGSANFVGGAATGMADTAEFIQRNAPFVPYSDETKGKYQKLRDAMAAGLDFGSDNLNTKLNDSTLTGTLPKLAGGIAPLFVAGGAAGYLGKAAGLAPKAIGLLTQAATAGAGAAQGGNQMRNEAIKTLAPKLKDGTISQPEYRKALGLAEVFGTTTGAAQFIPISRVAQRFSSTGAGRTMLGVLLTRMAQGGSKAAVAWLKNEGRQAISDTLSEGIEQAGVGYLTSVANDLGAKEIFDPERHVDYLKASEQATGQGVAAAFLSALSHVRFSPRIQAKVDGTEGMEGWKAVAGEKPPEPPPEAPTAGTPAKPTKPGPVTDTSDNLGGFGSARQWSTSPAAQPSPSTAAKPVPQQPSGAAFESARAFHTTERAAERVRQSPEGKTALRDELRRKERDQETRKAGFTKTRAEEIKAGLAARQIAGPEETEFTGDAAKDQQSLLDARVGEEGAKKERARLAKLTAKPAVDDGAIPAGTELSKQAQELAASEGEELPPQRPKPSPLRSLTPTERLAKEDAARAKVAKEPAPSEPPDVKAETAPPERARYDELNAKLVSLTREGKPLGNPEVDAIHREMQEIKSRNDGMPPGETSGAETPVNSGPRNPEVSTGTGVPTAHEERMLAEQQRLIDEHNAAQKPTPEETTNALPKSGPAELLQRKPDEAGKAGGERGRVEQGQQGDEAARQGEAGKDQEVVRPEVAPKPDPIAVRRKAMVDAKAKRDAASAGVKQSETAPPQPRGKAATGTAPAGKGQQGSGKETVIPKAVKGKRISVGSHPSGEDDILNFIEQNGGVQTKSGAARRGRSGGEYDDLGSSFTGVARLLLRKDGMAPDQMAQMLHDAGHIADGHVRTMNAAVEAAVKSREMARKAIGQKEYGDRFERAFLGNDQGKKYLRAGKPISVDDLVAGDKFEVNGEKFEVKEVDENGNVKIKDGITKTVPPGTEVYPDKGLVKKAKRSKEFFPAEKPAATNDLKLASQTSEELAAETRAAREKQQAEAQSDKIKSKAEAPLTGDSSNVGQGQLLAQDEDLFSGESQETAVKKAEPAVTAPIESGNPAKDHAPVSQHIEEHTPETLEGDKLNQQWTAYHKEAGSLGIPRAEMPQVKSEHRGALANFMRARGIKTKGAMVLPGDLKPTQAEYSPEKVETARNFEGSERPVIISSDGHVVDGHHQWMAALDDPNTPMPVIRLEAPIDKVLAEMKEFPSAQAAEGAKPAESATRPAPPAQKRLSDRAIDALKSAKKKIDPTDLMSPQMGVNPLTAYNVARNAAIDAAILAIRAGRAAGDVVKLAVGRLKERFPDVTKEQIEELAAKIRLHMGDEKPAPPPTPEQKSTLGNSKVLDEIQRIFAPQTRGEDARTAAGALREHGAELAQRTDRAAAYLETARSRLDALPQSERWDFVHSVETGAKQANPELQPFADQMRKILDAKRDEVQSLGTGALDHFIEDYFPHIWQNPEKALTAFQEAAAKRPLEGGKSFLKQRTIPTTQEGLALGLKPVSNNPVDLALLRMREMDKYILAHKTLGELKDKGLVEMVPAGQEAPDGYKKIEDKIATIYGPRMGAVGLPAEAKVAGVKPGDVKVYGRRIMGEYYAPGPVAQVINNYLSPGLRNSAIFRGYLSMANTLNQFQLGLSAFHLGFTSLDASTSRLAVGLEDLAHGKVGDAAKAIASTPFAPFTNALKGDKVLKEWLRPGTQGADIARIVDSLKSAGGRAQMDHFYKTEITRKMLDNFRQGGAWNYAKGAMRAPFSGIELAAKPIMEWIVPRQKLGVFADMAKREFERLGPDASRDDVRRAMGKAWDSVDNRLGQLVYDNLFWKKAAKDLSMASVRSLGWNLGTLRELGGGAIDTMAAGKALVTKGEKAEFTHRMAYLAAMPTLTGLMGATMGYMMTGKGPEELKDYFFPKTGEFDQQGRAIRLTLPAYMKDVYHYAHDPVGTMAGKVHPLITLGKDMLMNKDYFDRPIRNSDDPFIKQLLDSAAYTGKQFLPIGIGQAIQSNKTGQTGLEQAGNFVGVLRAAKWVSMSDAEQLAEKLNAGHSTSASIPTAGGQYRYENQTSILGKLRNGTPAERQSALGELHSMVQQDQLTEQAAKRLVTNSKGAYLTNQLTHLDANEAVRVYRVSTPDEKRLIKDMVQKKIERSHLPEADKKSLTNEIQRLAKAA